MNFFIFLMTMILTLQKKDHGVTLIKPNVVKGEVIDNCGWHIDFPINTYT